MRPGVCTRALVSPPQRIDLIAELVIAPGPSGAGRDRVAGCAAAAGADVQEGDLLHAEHLCRGLDRRFDAVAGYDR